MQSFVFFLAERQGTHGVVWSVSRLAFAIGSTHNAPVIINTATFCGEDLSVAIRKQ